MELRICDFISDVDLLLAITALLELRILFLFQNVENLDPLLSSQFSLDQLKNICDTNELEVAKNSLNAKLKHWLNGEQISCKDWITNLLNELEPLANQLNMSHLLQPIFRVLEEGNQSIKWINKYNQGCSIEEIMKFEIENMVQNEDEFNLRFK